MIGYLFNCVMYIYLYIRPTNYEVASIKAVDGGGGVYSFSLRRCFDN